MRDNVKGGALTEVTFYILLSLFTPKHGYAIMQFIEEKTGGRLSLGAGTLYGALNTLEDKGWIARYGNNEGRRKEYLITALGKEIAEIELARLQELTQTATKIIGAFYGQEMLSLLRRSNRVTGKMAEQDGEKRLQADSCRETVL